MDWTVCAEAGTEAVLCGAGAERLHPPPAAALPSLYQGPVQCLLVAVLPRPPPAFSRCDAFAAAGPGASAAGAWLGCDMFLGSPVGPGGVYPAQMGAKVRAQSERERAREKGERERARERTREGEEEGGRGREREREAVYPAQMAMCSLSL